MPFDAMRSPNINPIIFFMLSNEREFVLIGKTIAEHKPLRACVLLFKKHILYAIENQCKDVLSAKIL